MTLSTVLLYVAIVAVILTIATYFLLKKKESLVMSYLQHFCGALFIFSGWVKAVDPLGTAYKMEDYFEQFEFVFEGTWFSFLSPMFPVLSTYSVGFSVFVIVLEIILGVMLILGHKPKFTSWAFLLLVGFFTILTGFTYLTGYVPGDASFFQFSKWAEYDPNNMKVTDCGCFGDFIKLEPKISFFKDVFLMIPAVIFLLRSRSMHTILTRTIRNIIVAVVGAGLIYYCMSNYIWDIPQNDFRPFKKSRDIGKQKLLEEEAQANIQNLEAILVNKASGEEKVIPYNEYISTFQDYPSEEWEIDYTQSEPTILPSKISEFDVFDADGNSLNDALLYSEGPVVFLVAHKLYGDGSPSTRIVKDTTYQVDTIYRRDGSIDLQRSIASVDERTESYIDYMWKDFYAERYNEVVIPFIEKAKAAGLPVIAVVGGADFEQIKDFSGDLGLDVTFGTADDLLLKTIVRSNPGIVLMDKGTLVDKWHYKKLPLFDVVKETYLQ